MLKPGGAVCGPLGRTGLCFSPGLHELSPAPRPSVYPSLGRIVTAQLLDTCVRW